MKVAGKVSARISGIEWTPPSARPIWCEPSWYSVPSLDDGGGEWMNGGSAFESCFYCKWHAREWKIPVNVARQLLLWLICRFAHRAKTMWPHQQYAVGVQNGPLLLLPRHRRMSRQTHQQGPCHIHLTYRVWFNPFLFIVLLSSPTDGCMFIVFHIRGYSFTSFANKAAAAEAPFTSGFCLWL